MDTFFITLSTRQVAFFVGALGAALSIPFLVAPPACRHYLPGFPRSTAAAWTFTAIDLLWVAWMVTHASLGRFDFLKPGLYILTPVAFFLLINFLDELLTARALGGFLLLAANPVLNFARWNDSSWRFVLSGLAYVWVVAGMTLVLSPYMLRRWCLPVLKTDGRCRAAGAAGLALAALILYLGVAVY